MLEMMSKKDKACATCSTASQRYFISGEINTKLQAMDAVPAKLDEIAAKYADGDQYSSTGFRWSTRTGTSTCGRRTPSRCCA